MDAVKLKIIDKDIEGNYAYLYHPGGLDDDFVMGPYAEAESVEVFKEHQLDFSVNLLSEIFKTYTINDHNLLLEAARDFPSLRDVYRHTQKIQDSDSLRTMIDGMHFFYNERDTYNSIETSKADELSNYVFLIGETQKPLFFSKSEVDALKLSFEHESRYAGSTDDFV